MDFSQFHFAYPLWLWGASVIPLIWLLFFLFYRPQHSFNHLEKFIDHHLLPYLLLNNGERKKTVWKPLLIWSLVWLCLDLALAGPRWDFREVEIFSPDQSLVILLDLSESMNATDMKPSRLVRAKQKIEDLINLSKGVKIGLIAFAADPHMITPITDDKETIRHLLPSLDTDLVYVQGSRLSPALEMAIKMLDAESGSNKALLVISDGGFEDASAITTAKKLAEKGIMIHVMGIGTIEGAPLQDHEGNIIRKNGAPILSKLERDKLGEIGKVGNGYYLEGHYSDDDAIVILKELNQHSDAQVSVGKKNRFWDEYFYLLVFPVLPFILWWFRRGYIFAAVVAFFLPFCGLEALDISGYFKNSEELGKQALDSGDYETACGVFQDPYRRGIAYYRAGNFVEAEKMFRNSSRTDVSINATYNLGNALVQQQKFQEAIDAYEDVLKQCPEHIKAKENLELVKKMLEQQEKESSKSENSDPQKNQSQEETGNEDKRDGTDSEDQDSGKEQHEPQSSGKKQEPQKENPEANDGQSEEQEGATEQQEIGEAEDSQDADSEAKVCKSQEDLDADLWLNRIENDSKTFLKNKFYVESKKNGTTEGIDPW